MTIKRATKHFFTMVLISAAMLAIVFSFDSEQVFAENKPLQKGQIFRVGTCSVPGEGYGPNGGYFLTSTGDTFTYNGEWYYGNSSKTYATYIRGEDHDEDEFYKEPVTLAYPNQTHCWNGSIMGGTGEEYTRDLPDAYYNSSKYVDAYEFYMITGHEYKYPMTIHCTAVNQGVPWGIQVASGDGTKENPFFFQVLFGEPYEIKINVGEHGYADVKAGASADEKVKIEKLKADVGYEVDKIVVSSDDGTSIKKTEIKPEVDGDYGTYYFIMPEADVTVDVSFKEKEGVVRVTDKDGNTTLFNSFKDALSAWNDGATLVVNDGLKFDGPVTITDNRTLDLNGYVLKTDGKAFVVKGGGSLTIKDSKPGRATSFEGKNYKGGWLFGSVNGKDENGDYVISGIIDVAQGSVTMNGGSLVNDYGQYNDFKYVFGATTGANITVNDGYIKTSKVVIVDSKRNVKIRFTGGRYEIDAWPVQSEVPNGSGGSDHSMVAITGGYYSYDISSYYGIADGYHFEYYKDELDWDWAYSNFKYRVTDDRTPYKLEVPGDIEHGSLSVSGKSARVGDVVTLSATPEEHYRLQKYEVKDADGNSVEVNDGQFTMPDSQITINAVFEPVTVSKIRINKLRVTIDEGETYQLKAVVTPADALDKTVTWSSNDEGVATVDADGKVQAVKAGKAKITCASNDGGDKVVCSVTVHHEHSLHHVEGVEESCVSWGSIEYWYCSEGDYPCYKLFTDEKGENEISAAAIDTMENKYKHRTLETRETIYASDCTDPWEEVTEEYCPDCNEVVSTTRILRGAPLGHDWSEWKTEKEPTDTEPGLQTRTCSRGRGGGICNETEERKIPPLNHTQHNCQKVEGHIATCKNPGNIEYWVCSDPDCGRFFSDEEGTTEIDPKDVVVKALGEHRMSYEKRENENAATCTSPATYDSVFYCVDCGEETGRSLKTEGSPLGHDWTDCKMYDVNDHVFTCSRCGAETTSPHNWDDGREIPPTCKDKGKTVYTCMDCGYMLDTNFVYDEVAHVLGDSVKENRVNATTTSVGGYDLVKRCTICGEVINKTHVVIPRLKEDEYNIDIKTSVEGSEDETGGTVSGGADKGKKGEGYDITADPDDGFDFLYWLIGGKKQEGRKYNLFVNATDPATEVTVEAVFKRSDIQFKGSTTLNVNEAYNLANKLYSRGTMPEDIVWKSSDEKVAGVNSAGIIYGVAVGEAEITGTLADGTVAVSYTVTVENPVAEAKEALKNAIADAKKVESGKYTDESFKALQDAIAEAEALARDDNATAEQLKAAMDKIAEAKAGLKEKGSKSDKPATKVGDTVKYSGNTYKVTSVKSKTAAFAKAKNAKSIVIPATIKINGETYKVTSIKSKAFKGSKATKLTVKTKKLTKKSVKGSLKGSKIKTVKVKIGKKSVNKKCVKKYKKIFTKKNAGKKVRVK